MTIKELKEKSWQTAQEKGFWDNLMDYLQIQMILKKKNYIEIMQLQKN
jgi:hypothetical protein